MIEGAKFDVLIFHSYLRIRKINLTKICYYGLSASCESWMSSVNIHKKKKNKKNNAFLIKNSYPVFIYEDLMTIFKKKNLNNNKQH